MADSFPGRDGRPHEPQCYNCGSFGHWAVACPEPTRATPAGLAAWKSASSPSQSAPKSHGNPSKRSKGPIITKYAPPPPLPQPQPQPPSYGPGPGMGQYQPPPPPPGNHQHPSMYSAPPPAPHYPQYGPPPPSYPPGYAQPPYSYAPGQPYAPPAPYAAPPQYTPPGYARPLPGPPPPAPYSSAPPAHDHRSPPPYYSHTQPPPSSYGHSPSSHHSPRPPPPQHSRSAPSGSAHTAPKPPPARLSHPLPPKPPPSQDQIKFQRDNRNKRKNDRHDHQDKRHRDQKAAKHGNHGSHHDTSESSDPSARRHSSSHGSPPGRPNHGRPRHNSQQPRKGSSHTGKPVIASGSPGKKESTRSEQRSGGTNTHVQEPPTLAESGRDDEAVREKEADTPHDSPVTQMETAENSTPVDKPVDVNVAPERNVDDDAAETKTVSTDKEDGEIGNDDAVASTTSVPELAASDHHRQSVSNEPGVRDKRSRSNDPEERQRHKKRRPDSPAPKSDRTSESGTLNGTLWDGLAVPRQADRTRRGSAGSAGSRQSSVAGNSSDLNSLERELLGRPVKQKHRGDSPRSERKPAKAKRRQANANSAYSRRW